MLLRTTIRLDEDLLRQAKARAAQTGQTLTQLISDALRRALAPKPARPANRVGLPTVPGALRAGVDFSDNVALRDFLDRSDASA